MAPGLLLQAGLDNGAKLLDVICCTHLPRPCVGTEEEVYLNCTPKGGLVRLCLPQCQIQCTQEADDLLS